MNHVPGTGFMLWWEIIVNSPNEHSVSRCFEVAKVLLLHFKTIQGNGHICGYQKYCFII